MTSRRMWRRMMTYDQEKHRMTTYLQLFGLQLMSIFLFFQENPYGL